MKINLAILLCCSMVWGTVANLTESCTLYLYPDAKSKVRCEKSKDTPYLVLKPLTQGFVGIKTFDCVGWVPVNCTTEKVSQAPQRTKFYKRDIASEEERFLSIGLLAPLAMPIALTPDASSATGMQWGGSLEVFFRLSSAFRLDLQAGFQQYIMTRRVDGSGSITDTSSSFTQTLSYLTGSLLLAYRFSEEMGHEKELLTDEWWVRGGFAYGHPWTASQTASFGVTTSFTPTDKLLFGVVSLTNKMNLSSSLSVWPSLFGYYQILAASGSMLFGAGVTVALHLQL